MSASVCVGNLKYATNAYGLNPLSTDTLLVPWQNVANIFELDTSAYVTSNLTTTPVQDEEIYLWDGTSQIGTNQAIAGDWASSTRGSISNMWGLSSATLTPAIINGDDFGFTIRGKSTASGKKTDTLVVNKFNFDIPINATIVGIQIRLNINSSGANARIGDAYIYVCYTIPSEIFAWEQIGNSFSADFYCDDYNYQIRSSATTANGAMAGDGSNFLTVNKLNAVIPPPANELGIGQSQFNFAEYILAQCFVGFDTSSLPDNAVVYDAYVELFRRSNGTTVYSVPVQLNIYNFAWTGNTTADFRTTANIASLELCGTTTLSDTRAFERFKVVSKPEMIDAINVSGITKFLLIDSMSASGSFPDRGAGSNNANINVYGWGSGHGERPKLTVKYYLSAENTGANIKKHYDVSIYDNDNVFLKTWSDKELINEPEYTQEINNGGSQCTIELARAVDDLTSELELGYRVVVTAYDNEKPAGQNIIQGKISQIKYDYDAQEKVVITVLGHGSELNNQIIETVENIVLKDGEVPTVVNNYTRTTLAGWVGASFVASSNNITSIQLWQSGVTAIGTIRIYDDNLGVAGNLLYERYAELIGTDAVTGYKQHELKISPYLAITNGERYHVMFGALASNQITPVYTVNNPNEYLSEVSFGGVRTITKTKSANFQVYGGDIGTTLEYLNTDPSVIFKDLIDSFNNQGGIVSYSANSIQTTGTSVDYSFKVSNVLEGLQKVYNLLPVGWHWYIDQSNNIIYLTDRTTETTHEFTLGKEILSISPQMTNEYIVNQVLFSGGAVGGVNLYKKYINQNSIDAYGLKSKSVSDGRVTLTATANTMANNILDNYGSPDVKLSINIVDNNLAGAGKVLGYDIESIRVGQQVKFANFKTTNEELGVWGLGTWGEFYWGYNLKNIATLYLEIVRIKYTMNNIELQLSLLPPMITKTLHEIDKNISELQTRLNPDTYA